MDQYQDVMDRLNGTKPVVERDPFIGAGRSDLIVLSVEPYNDKKLVDGIWVGHGPSVKAVFEVERSTSHAPGTRCVKLWHLFKPAKFQNKPTDADEFANFVCKLQGIPEGQHAAGCRAMLKPRAEGGLLEAQPARGSRITAIGTEVGKPNAHGKRFVQVRWESVTQDGATIAAARAALDQRAPFEATTASPTAAGPQAPAPQQYQAPAPQQYQAPAPITTAPQGGFLSLIK